MDLQFVHQPIEGLHRELFIGQQDRVDELNTRIGGRQFSDQPLRPCIDPRPVPTKYSLFPIVERRVQPHVPIQSVAVHRVPDNFNPATRKYPFSSYLDNYETEVALRNASVPLTKYGGAETYIPSSNSDMYRFQLPSIVGTGQNTEHPYLASRSEPLQTTGAPQLVEQIGTAPLFNHTRNQLRNIAPNHV